ncbi:hypothetical protein DOY81_005245 [Sarcophaga bullata]|nr:hypothetical protein DOY81_005245 [Sarcophaga bullata]
MSGVKRVISPCEEHNENSLKKLKKDELKPDESDTNSLEKQDNYDHVFDQDDGFDLKALEIAEKNVRIAKLDLTQWQRCIVKEISKNMRTFALVLHVSGKVKGEGGDQQEAEGKCHLQGPWYHTKVYVGNVVSVKAIWDKRLEIYKVDNDHGFCVINPDVLISSTSVVASMFCPRKTVLEDRFKNLEPDNKVMVIGSLVHELFQMVLEKGVKELKDIEKLAADLLKSRETAFKLYSSQLTQADTTSEVKHFVQSIYQFVQQYVDERQASTFPIQKESFQGCIAEINDIEENLWVPQLGIKGKIDVSVKIHPRPQKSKTVRKEQIVPLELKTGRASFSVEHRGQLILYEMMLTAIGQPTDTGLLLYLRENLMREIQGSRNEQRDLIFLRNELSNYLSVLSDNIALPEELQDEDEIHIHPFKLPEPISRPAACSRCKSATICCSFAKTELTVTKFLHDRERLELMALKMCHLSPGDLAYFVQWSQLLVMEELEVRKSDNSSALFSQTPKNRQQNGRAICNLKISQQPIEKEESRFKHQFVVVNPLNDSVHETQAEDNIDLTLSGFSVGEYVIVSTTNRLAIATGYVTELTSSTVTVNLERNLEKKYKQQTFIIDKYESKSGDAFNFTTLGMLIEPTERSALLRAIVAERKPPIFKKMLPKIIATEGAPIMEQLNSVQRSAVIKALTTENYMLIKGLPGTGKLYLEIFQYYLYLIRIVFNYR